MPPAILAFALAFLIAAAGLAAANEEKAKPEEPRHIGKVAVYAKDKRIEVEAAVCLERGVLDYLAVTAGGREDESLFRLDGKPSSLHAALLAVGARPGPVAKEARADGRGDRDKPAPVAAPGTAVRIGVAWGEGKDARQAPVESWLTDRATGRPAAGMTWVFTGSFFGRYPNGEEVYVADVEKKVVALWYHGACVLNPGRDAGSPYRGDKLGYEVNADAVPPAGTPVRLIFEVVAPEEKEKPRPPAAKGE